MPVHLLRCLGLVCFLLPKIIFGTQNSYFGGYDLSEQSEKHVMGLLRGFFILGENYLDLSLTKSINAEKFETPSDTSNAPLSYVSIYYYNTTQSSTCNSDVYAAVSVGIGVCYNSNGNGTLTTLVTYTSNAIGSAIKITTYNGAGCTGSIYYTYTLPVGCLGFFNVVISSTVSFALAGSGYYLNIYDSPADCNSQTPAGLEGGIFFPTTSTGCIIVPGLTTSTQVSCSVVDGVESITLAVYQSSTCTGSYSSQVILPSTYMCNYPITGYQVTGYAYESCQSIGSVPTALPILMVPTPVPTAINMPVSPSSLQPSSATNKPLSNPTKNLSPSFKPSKKPTRKPTKKPTRKPTNKPNKSNVLLKALPKVFGF